METQIGQKVKLIGSGKIGYVEGIEGRMFRVMNHEGLDKWFGHRAFKLVKRGRKLGSKNKPKFVNAPGEVLHLPDSEQGVKDYHKLPKINEEDYVVIPNVLVYSVCFLLGFVVAIILFNSAIINAL